MKFSIWIVVSILIIFDDYLTHSLSNFMPVPKQNICKLEPSTRNSFTNAISLTYETAEARLESWQRMSNIENVNKQYVVNTLPDSEATASGQKVSAFLAHVFGTKSRASKACKQGHVTFKGKKVFGTHIVNAGDAIDVIFPPTEGMPINESEKGERKSKILLTTQFIEHIYRYAHDHPNPVLYEDDSLAVIYKPAGVHSLAWLGTRKKNVLALDDCLPLLLSPPTTMSQTQAKSGATSIQSTKWDSLERITSDELTTDCLPRPLPCHRLDARVAGCLIVAKTKSALTNMCRQFEAQTVKKEYRAVLAGTPLSPKSQLPLGQNETFELNIPVFGRDARTTGKVLDTVPCNVYGNMTLVALYPHTGRRHQLRQHCAALGAPIVGDDLYHDCATYTHLLGRVAALSRVTLAGRTRDETDIDIEDGAESIDDVDESSSDFATISTDVKSDLSKIDRREDYPPVRRGVGLFLASVRVEFTHPWSPTPDDTVESVDVERNCQRAHRNQGERDAKASAPTASKTVVVDLFHSIQDHKAKSPSKFIATMDKAKKGHEWAAMQRNV